MRAWVTVCACMCVSKEVIRDLLDEFSKINHYARKFSVFVYYPKLYCLCIYCLFLLQAVYKNYDHDRDGFISHAEFEAIAGNFPFIDSFCVLDADQ